MEDHQERAEELEHEADALEHEGDKVERDIEETRGDWESKQEASDVPGAVPEEGQQDQEPDQAQAEEDE
jgi:hypothetical protein